MESGGPEVRERRKEIAWWLGALAVVVMIPAIVVFVTRDRVGRSGSPAEPQFLSNADVAQIDADGVVENGVGECTVSGDALVIEGKGMTSCRTSYWSAVPYLDQLVSTQVSGIDQGATVVMRLRESGDDRIEVAVGRSQVRIREKRDDQWNELTSTPRQTPTTMTSLATLLNPTDQLLQVSLSGNVVAVDIDGVEIASAQTSVDEQGLFSIGAITDETVAVRLTSLIVTDAG